MKLISLNTWAGRAGKEKLQDFFEYNKDVDIFCLQEMWEGGYDHASKWGEGIDANLITNTSHILHKYNVFFRPHYMDWYGLAIFIKKDITIHEEGDIFVFKERENVFDEDGAVNHARNLQYIKFETEKGPRIVMNFHGLWNGGKGKGDSDDRFLQSDNIIRFLKNLSDPHVLCGDFNLNPDTISLKKLQDSGLKDLIKEHKITSTRSRFYTKPEQFADYTLVSKDIVVNEFKVLPDEVSDHLAMYLDFE